jgi:serine/threonine-protein kinase
MSILTELKRRGVSRIVASYAVIAWLLIQIIVSVEAPLGLPAWSDTLVIVGLIIGFPVCAVLAWIYDFTDRGIERTAEMVAPPGSRRATLTRADIWTLVAASTATLLLLGTGVYFLTTNVTRSVETLAILPFELDMVGPESTYLGEGLRDSLILRMSRLNDLRIRTTSAHDTATADPQALSGVLGADAIAQGTITQRGNAIDIAAELISADGAILWRDEYSTEATSLLSIESAICIELANRLGRELSAAEALALAREPTSNSAAHRLYQQGRYFWNRRTTQAFLQSIDFYNRAIALDPNFALAYAGLADTYLMLLGWGIQPPAEVAESVVMAAEQAIRLDPTLAHPHAALGYFKTLYERDWNGAREEFLTAITLDNNYSSAHHWYAFLLMTEGNMTAAIEEILLAREAEPLSPIINAEVGYFLNFDRQYERAIAELESAVLLDPNYPSTVIYLGRAHALLGQTELALEYIERWRGLDAQNLIVSGYGAMALPLIGLNDEARTIYDRLLTAAESMYVQSGVLAGLAGVLGDYDAAFDHIDAGLADGSLIVSWLRDPLLDGLRADPRYAELMTGLGLTP